MVTLRNAILSAGIALMVSVPSFAQKSTSTLFKHPSSQLEKKTTVKKKVLSDEEFEANFQEVLEHVAAYQEREMGIHYDSLPNIKIDDEQTAHVAATYNYVVGAVFVRSNYKNIDISLLQKNIESEKLSKVAMDLRDVLSHELGHFYTHCLVEKYGKDSWLYPAFQKGFDIHSSTLDSFLIVEGIGEYFGDILNKDPTYYNNIDWNRDLPTNFTSSYLNRLIYSGGENVVRPILEHDLKKGLNYILSHELELIIPDLSSVAKYKTAAETYFTNNSD